VIDSHLDNKSQQTIKA